MNRTETRLTTPPREDATPRQLLGAKPPIGEITLPPGVSLPGLDTSDSYALSLVGRALEPLASHGDYAIVLPNVRCNAGNFVALIPMDPCKAVLVRRLALVPAVPIGVHHPASNVRGAVLVELVSEKQLEEYPAEEVKAMHRVIGFLRADGSKVEIPVPERVRGQH